MNLTPEVVVVGGGVMGCSILYNLANQGMNNAVLLEQEVLGWGSSSRGNAIIRMHYSNEVTTLLARDSLKIFKDFDQIVGGNPQFDVLGWLLIVGQNNQTAMEINVRMQSALGINTTLVTSEEVGEIVPDITLSDGEACAFEPDSGTANPLEVTKAYGERAKELGSQIEFGVRVVGIDVQGGRVTGVLTNRGKISTSAVVLATGPWSQQFFAHMGIAAPFKSIRHSIVALHYPAAAPDGLPTVNDVVHSFSARPSGRVSLVGVGEEEEVQTDDYNQGIDPHIGYVTLRSLSKRLPFMTGSTLAGGWSGLFTVTPDWHPVLGKIPEIDGLFCATGFSGHGFKLSPMVGVVMSELVTSKEPTSIDVSSLGIKRFETGDLLESSYGMRVLA